MTKIVQVIGREFSPVVTVPRNGFVGGKVVAKDVEEFLEGSTYMRRMFGDQEDEVEEAGEGVNDAEHVDEAFTRRRHGTADITAEELAKVFEFTVDGGDGRLAGATGGACIARMLEGRRDGRRREVDGAGREEFEARERSMKEATMELEAGEADGESVL